MTKNSHLEQSHGHMNSLWSALFVEECVRNGVFRFCIAPGSRSTPLAVAAARHPDTECLVHFDERGLAFLALGAVMASRQPVVVITTSGTAVANLYPGLIEASKKKLPMIVCTADRPPELQYTGANQTIDQNRIFSDTYLKWFFNMPSPTADIDPAFVLTTTDQAIQLARSPGRSGVVHLNWSFPEPLLSDLATHDNLEDLNGTALQHWLNHDEPYTTHIYSEAKLNFSLANINLQAQDRGLIVVGKVSDQSVRDDIVCLAHKLGWPILADVASGLRHQSAAIEVIHHWEPFVEALTKANFTLDFVLHLGGRIMDLSWYDYIKACPPKSYVTVLEHPLRNDPAHRVTQRIHASIDDVCQKLLKHLADKNHANKSKWLTAWHQRDQALAKVYQTHLQSSSQTLTEPVFARRLTASLPSDWDFFVGNSLPIRYLNHFCHRQSQALTLVSNRGASGIDGNLATAYGWQSVRRQPLAIWIGDLTALYDLNALSLFKDAKAPVVLFVLNNQGGGIFEQLPIAQQADVCEKFFVAKHQWNFQGAAQMFGWDYKNINTLEAWQLNCQNIFSSTGCLLCEVEISSQVSKAFLSHLKKDIVNVMDQFIMQ